MVTHGKEVCGGSDCVGAEDTDRMSDAKMSVSEGTERSRFCGTKGKRGLSRENIIYT